MLSKTSGDNGKTLLTQVAVVDEGSFLRACQSKYESHEWIVDKKATHHITSKDVVDKIKNGIHLPNVKTVAVSHLGSTTVLASHTISNVLYLPDFKINLMSVSKITKELQCMVGFFPKFCIFQDLYIGQVCNF